jgi:hypothetical protein
MATLTCLQIVQAACRRIGILAPNTATSATDQQIIQLVELCNEEGQELASRIQWTALQSEAVFLTVATESQGAMSTLASGFKYMVNDTIWNRDLRRPVYGARSEQEWQQQKAIQLNGPFNSFRIFQGNLQFYPVPAAGQTCAFEYASSDWVNKSIGGTDSSWTNDLDTPKLDAQLIVLGAIWRWKAAKGLDYAEDFAKYERRVNDAIGRDGSKPTLNTTGAQYDIQPIVLVPTGSWGV